MGRRQGKMMWLPGPSLSMRAVCQHPPSIHQNEKRLTDDNIGGRWSVSFFSFLAVVIRICLEFMKKKD